MGCKELVTTEQLGTAHGGDGMCPFPQSIWDASVIQGRTLLQVFSRQRQRVTVRNCPKESPLHLQLSFWSKLKTGEVGKSLCIFLKIIIIVIFIYFLSAVHACRIFVPQSWIQLCPLQWKHIVPATDPPGKFLSLPLNTSSKESFIHCCGLEHEQLSPGKKLLTQIKCHE